MNGSIKAIIKLLKQYGATLFTRCPSSRDLVLYAEQPDELPVKARRRIGTHLTVCLSCRDKVRWCQAGDQDVFKP